MFSSAYRKPVLLVLHVLTDITLFSISIIPSVNRIIPPLALYLGQIHPYPAVERTLLPANATGGSCIIIPNTRCSFEGPPREPQYNVVPEEPKVQGYRLWQKGQCFVS